MARTERFGRRQRRHGSAVPFDRSQLEAEGWRTTLEYRENLVRSRGGRLLQLRASWQAAAERDAEGGPIVVTATAPTADKVWLRLRRAADLARVRGRAARDPVSVDAG